MPQAEELLPLSPFRSVSVQPLRAESIFKSSKHTTTHSQALSFPKPQGTGCLVREVGCEVTAWLAELLLPVPSTLLKCCSLYSLGSPVSSVLTHSPS